LTDNGNCTASGIRVENCEFAGLVSLGSEAEFVDCEVISPGGFGIVSQFSSRVTLENCVVESSAWSSGLWVLECDSVLVSNSSFTGNFLAGIDVVSSNIRIDSTSIVANGECGIKTSGDGGLSLRNSIVDSNPTGIVCMDAVSCDLGDLQTGCGGLNEITNYSLYAVSNLTGYAVKAELNWWGTADPPSSVFNGEVDFTPCLTGPGITAARGRSPALYPSKICLRSPSPNPSRALSRIHFDVPAPGAKVRIRVFNVRGELVQTLVDGRISPGHRSVVWEGLDSNGRAVSSGTYFVLMEAPGYSKSEKLILLR
jgi:hypothetical protein